MGKALIASNRYYNTQHWKDLRKVALRRAHGACEIKGCTSTFRLHVDHIKTRPKDADGPTSFDVISNVRVLCDDHDRQIKELPSGERRRSGKPVVCGCDEQGRPLDPGHHWRS